MKLHSEYLPATGVARQELVLLHGWGTNREVWRALLARVRSWANVTLLDIPGCVPQGDGAPTPQLESVLESVLELCPAHAVYLGWSLGGQLAIELAQRFGSRVAAVVTLCSNPRFIAADSWPGMPEQSFEGFLRRAQSGPAAAVSRFHALQAGGSVDESALRRQLRRLQPDVAGPSVLAGLDWLAELDQRDALVRLAQPQLHLLAERDALVPVACAAALGSLLADKPVARVDTLAGLGHLALLEDPPGLAQKIEEFLAAAGLLAAAEPEAPRVAKHAVADSFSRAASTYDSMAHLQRVVGQRLLQRLDALEGAGKIVLDLGCGTGFFRGELQRRAPGARYLGLDIAPGMVRFARSHGEEADGWLVGDAEALPLATASVDLVFSSLAMQWCYRPESLFAELYRVLRPGGTCVFTSLGPDTLKELRSSWAAVDERQHVNDFLPLERLEAAAATVPGLVLALEREECRMEYDRVKELLAELKAIGAHNINRGRPEGLTGRGALQGMLKTYETFRENGRLPATYEVIYGTLEKPAS